MTVSEFDLVLKFLGGFSVGLICMSMIMLRYFDLSVDTRDFVKSMGLGVGLCVGGIYLILSTLN